MDWTISIRSSIVLTEANRQGENRKLMKIAILGGGNVGAALGKGWARAGHQVTYGLRRPDSEDAARLTADGKCRAAGVEDAARDAEVVVLALPWDVTKSVVASLPLDGKIVLDCTNPLLPRLAGLEIGTTSSAGELVQSWAPGARVVKIFNTTGSANMADSKYPEGAPVMFYCGNDPAANQAAHKLAADLGFDPVAVGGIENARLLEPAAMLWITLGVKLGMGPNFAMRLMRR